MTLETCGDSCDALGWRVRNVTGDDTSRSYTDDKDDV